jgi:hypothetical protein
MARLPPQVKGKLVKIQLPHRGQYSATVDTVDRQCPGRCLRDGRTAGFHRSARFGLGIDLAADEARNLLPDAIPVDGPVPVGDEPAGLLRSAEQLLRRVTIPGDGAGLHVLWTQVADLVREANTSVGG